MHHLSVHFKSWLIIRPKCPDKYFWASSSAIQIFASLNTFLVAIPRKKIYDSRLFIEPYFSLIDVRMIQLVLIILTVLC